jgi:hypothetical protein
VVVLLLPLSLAIDDGKFSAGDGSGGGVVGGVFDSSGSVAAFDGGNGLRQGNGEREMSIDSGGGRWWR